MDYVTYDVARGYAQRKGIRSQQEWNFHLLISKFNNTLAKGIPKAPEAFYKRRGSWKTWSDFLGTNNRKYINYMTFEEAKKLVSFFKIKNQKEWFYYCKHFKPKNIPADCRAVYKDEWKGWSDFLRNEKTRKGNHMPFEKAREYVRKLKLKSRQEFYDLKQRGLIPITIPRSPDKVYA